MADIAAEVFTNPWSRQGFAEALPMENACFLLAVKKEIVCGYCGGYIAADEAEILNVAVKPTFQRQGIRKDFYKEIHEDAYVMNRVTE